MRCWKLRLGLLALIVPHIAGCGGKADGPTLIPASGTVVYKNAPLSDVNVTFLPASGPAATGATDSDGRFSLKTNGQAGAVAGKHKVSVASSATPPMPGTPEAKTAAQASFPAKYGNPASSGLEVTLPNEGQSIELKLVD